MLLMVTPCLSFIYTTVARMPSLPAAVIVVCLRDAPISAHKYTNSNAHFAEHDDADIACLRIFTGKEREQHEGSFVSDKGAYPDD